MEGDPLFELVDCEQLSTSEHGAEQQVWGWWAHPQARSAEDGDRWGHQDGGMGGGDF